MREDQRKAREARDKLLEDYFSEPPENVNERRKYFTVYTVLRHVSASGMTRVIDCYVVRNNELCIISRNVAKACQDIIDRNYGGIKVKGCGMDMGFAVVNNLSICLFCHDKYEHEAAYKLHHQWI